MEEKTQIEPFVYDKEADVLYFSLGTGEPSYSEEVTDFLFLDRGLFTNTITGFRVLDVLHHGIRKVEVTLERVASQMISEAQEREQQIREFMEHIDLGALLKKETTIRPSRRHS